MLQFTIFNLHLKDLKIVPSSFVEFYRLLGVSSFTVYSLPQARYGDVLDCNYNHNHNGNHNGNDDDNGKAMAMTMTITMAMTMAMGRRKMIMIKLAMITGTSNAEGSRILQVLKEKNITLFVSDPGVP